MLISRRIIYKQRKRGGDHEKWQFLVLGHNLTNNGQFPKCKDIFQVLQERVLPKRRLRPQRSRAWTHPRSAHQSTPAAFTHAVATVALTGLACLNVFGRKQPDSSAVDEAISPESLFLPLLEILTFLLSLAPQGLLACFVKCYSFERVQGTGDYSRQCLSLVMVYYFSKQRTNQFEIFSFKCLSSVLFYLFALKFAAKFRFSYTFQRAQVRTEHLFRLWITKMYKRPTMESGRLNFVLAASLWIQFQLSEWSHIAIQG